MDVVLEYKTPESDDWAEVTNDTILFGEESLWEPGHTEVVALRIRNAGTLALKYDLATTVYEEVAGTNVAGKPFKLSDYLEVGYSAIQQDGVIGDIFMSLLLGNRDNAVSLANSEFGKSVDNPNPMILPGESHVCALAITMPTTVGNEANYKTGTEAPYISFGVTVLATQATEEYDSFDNQYDADADYVAQFTEGTHELNATLKATKPGDTVSATGTDTVVNIIGGSYDAGSIYNNCAVWAHAGATINIHDGTFIADGDTAEQNSGHHYDLIYAGSSKDSEQSYVNIYGGMFSVRNNGWLLNEADGKGNITVYGGTFVNWNPADNESEGANTNFLADGYTVTKETKANGDVWYTVVKGTYVANATELATLLKTDATELNIILADGEYKNVLTASNKKINIKGGKGAVLSVTDNGGNHAHMSLQNCDVTIEGVTCTFSGNYPAYINNPTIKYVDCTLKGQFYLYGDTSFIGCTFENADEAAKTGFNYIYTYGNTEHIDVLVDDCIFNTQGHGLIMFSDNGGAGKVTMTVRDSDFHGGAGRTAWAVANQNTAAIEIDGSCGAVYTLKLEGNNTFDGGFSGLWRIKAMKSSVTINVNGVEYTGDSDDVYLDGVHYTKDTDRNVTKAED